MKKTIHKTLFALAATTSISLSSYAVYAADLVSTKTTSQTKHESDGNYENKKTEVTKDENGTTTSDTSKVKVESNEDGTYKKTIESKASKDPKGLNNKSSAKSSETIENEDGKYEDNVSTVTKNGITGTKTTTDGSVEVKTDSDGDVKKTVKTKVTKDPKGLNNKTVVETSDKLENSKDKKKYTYTKKVNGKLVEDKSIESK